MQWDVIGKTTLKNMVHKDWTEKMKDLSLMSLSYVIFFWLSKIYSCTGAFGITFGITFGQILLDQNALSSQETIKPHYLWEMVFKVIHLIYLDSIIQGNGKRIQYIENYQTKTI